MPQLIREVDRQTEAEEQISSLHHHIHQADGGLLFDIVLHLLHQVIGDDHYLLL